MAIVSSSTNVIAPSAANRAVPNPMPPQSSQMKNFAGCVALRTFHHGRKSRASVQISVLLAVHPCPIPFGVYRISGFPLGCLNPVVVWKSPPIYASPQKPLGNSPRFKECAMTNCQIFPKFLHCYTLPMPNTAFHPMSPAGFARFRRQISLNVRPHKPISMITALRIAPNAVSPAPTFPVQFLCSRRVL